MQNKMVVVVKNDKNKNKTGQNHNSKKNKNNETNKQTRKKKTEKEIDGVFLWSFWEIEDSLPVFCVVQETNADGRNKPLGECIQLILQT